MPQEPVTVPCGSCRACCQHEYVMLFPELGDAVENYEHNVVQFENGDALRVLRQHENGDCVYLDNKTGCTIHDRAPAVCKAFDCRAYFLSMTRNDRRMIERQAASKFAIFAAGRKRLETLTPEQHQSAIARRANNNAGVYLGDKKVL